MAQVANTTVNGVRISTIHVTDHQGVETVETMLFGKGIRALDGYRSWNNIPDAIKGHERIVANVRGGRLTVWTDTID